MIRINPIRDNKVTTDDVNLVEDTLGPDIRILKGNIGRIFQPIVIDYHTEILKELLSVNMNITISIDRLTVNKLAFFNIHRS